MSSSFAGLMVRNNPIRMMIAAMIFGQKFGESGVLDASRLIDAEGDEQEEDQEAEYQHPDTGQTLASHGGASRLRTMTKHD